MLLQGPSELLSLSALIYFYTDSHPFACSKDIMMGYLNRPDADAETLLTDKDGVWLKTGDIGYVDQDGYWFVTDRMKELVSCFVVF